MILQQSKIRFELLGRFQQFWRGMRYLMSSPTPKENCWRPGQITEVGAQVDGNYAIVVLNMKIEIPRGIVEKLWQNAKIRLTVDGGTDRWLSYIKNSCKDKCLKLPDLITGDFDSISEEALKHFSNTTTRKIHTPDQNETDFTKALRVLKPHVEKDGINKIIVFHETTGRFDHIMANINTLFKASKFLENVQIFLLSSNSLTWLLHPGTHSITIPTDLVEEERWCALIPFIGTATVSTKGLKWNLDNSDLEFGHLVSTSNTYSSKVISICTNKFLVWSMGVFDCKSDDKI